MDFSSFFASLYTSEIGLGVVIARLLFAAGLGAFLLTLLRFVTDAIPKTIEPPAKHEAGD
jgi:ABC-type multidrug transport system permease subunit